MFNSRNIWRRLFWLRISKLSLRRKWRCASDLRLIVDDLTSRIIVAGGGGGGGKNTRYSYYSPGGNGSGINGSDATSTGGTPGSGAYVTGPGEKGNKGSFGFGGNTSTSSKDGSGGGGGYYGGNGGFQVCCGGGGGSGYYDKSLFARPESFTGVREGNGMIKITRCFNCSEKTNVPKESKYKKYRIK